MSMRTMDIIRISSSSFRVHKMRTILTVLGVSIGIGAILFLISLGYGLERLTKNRLLNLEELSTMSISANSKLLSMDDETVKKINRVKGVVKVSPVIQKSAQITLGTVTTDGVVLGVEPKSVVVQNLKIGVGKVFATSTDKNAMVSSSILKLLKIDNPQDALGKEIKMKIFVENLVNGVSVLQPKGPLEFNVSAVVNMDTEDKLMFVGIDHLKNLGVTKYNLLKVKVEPRERLPEAKREIEGFGYNVSSVADSLTQIDKIFKVIQIVLAGFGVIAMFVAAIGMFNTLTISLLERTREVGVMKALGATNADVRKIFLTEGILMSLLGGLFGAGLALTLSFIVNFGVSLLARAAGGKPVDLFYTPFEFVILIFILASLVGLITGLYPARRAVKLSPIEALRYE